MPFGFTVERTNLGVGVELLGGGDVVGFVDCVLLGLEVVDSVARDSSVSLAISVTVKVLVGFGEAIELSPSSLMGSPSFCVRQMTPAASFGPQSCFFQPAKGHS